jgi:hypothetical protein
MRGEKIGADDRRQTDWQKCQMQIERIPADEMRHARQEIASERRDRKDPCHRAIDPLPVDGETVEIQRVLDDVLGGPDEHRVVDMERAGEERSQQKQAQTAEQQQVFGDTTFHKPQGKTDKGAESNDARQTSFCNRGATAVAILSMFLPRLKVEND